MSNYKRLFNVFNVGKLIDQTSKLLWNVIICNGNVECA